MPRRDWNTPSAHTPNRHHKPMHSAAKGKGHDHYIRKAKHTRMELCRICGRKAQKPRGD